jgi:hypothetical protein
MRLGLRALLLAATLGRLLSAQVPSDGPHVLWEGRTARVLEVRDGDQLGERRVQAPFKLDLPGLAARPLALQGRPYADAPDALPDPGRILAVSDIHGRFDSVLALLKAQGVVDGNLRWTYGRGHLVVCGDVFDRGPQVTETLWFLRALEDAARRAGGAVHLLLGNHEAMVMGGDLRYLHPRYARTPAGLPPLTELYGPASELGRWLRSRSTLLKLGPFLFAHGGPGPDFLAQGFDLKRTNHGVRKALGRSAKGSEGEAAFLLGSDGPLWYRGLVPGVSARDADDTHLAQLLRAFGVKAIVIGHTTVTALTALHGGRVFAIDAGLKEGKPGEAWIWEKGRAWRGTADGKREPLLP